MPSRNLTIAVLLVAGAASLNAQTPKRPKVGSDGSPVRLLRPGEQPAAAAPATHPAAVTTQAAAAPAAPTGAFTAGLALVPYGGSTDAARDAYGPPLTQ